MVVVVVQRINLGQRPIIALDPWQTFHHFWLFKHLFAQLRRVDEQQLDTFLFADFPDVGNSLELEERDKK